MRQQKENIIEVLELLPPEHIIRALEKGVEIEKLNLLANPDDDEAQQIVRSSRVLLAFLYTRKLGL
jgi:hypothetical protein